MNDVQERLRNELDATAFRARRSRSSFTHFGSMGPYDNVSEPARWYGILRPKSPIDCAEYQISLVVCEKQTLDQIAH